MGHMASLGVGGPPVVVTSPAPVYVSTALGSAAGTTSSTVTLSTTAVNDILILAAVNGGATATPTLTTGTFTETWALIDSGTWTTGFGGCWWARATGNHTGQTQICTGMTDSGASLVTRVSGCITSGSPIDASSGSSVAGMNAVSLASFNTTVANTLVVLIRCIDDNVSPTVAPTKNAVAFENGVAAPSSGGNDSDVFVNTWTQAAAGATGTFALTWNSVGTAEGSRLSGFSLKPP